MKTPLVICRVKPICDLAEPLDILDLFVMHLRDRAEATRYAKQKKKDFNIKRKKMIGDSKILC